MQPILPVVLAALSLLGCPGAKNVTPPAGSTGTPSQPRAVSGDAAAIAEELCRTATCAGPFASIQVWRDERGSIALLYFNGDIQRCSHPPGIFFDAEGKEKATYAMRAVSAEEAAKLQAERDALTKGLTKAEELSCRSAAPD